MPQAKNLAELFEIREHNRKVLDSIDNVSGTALGRKNGYGDPAVLVFVNKKVGLPWLPPAQVVPDRLSGPRGLECQTDVVSTETDRDFWIPTFFDEGANEVRGPERYARLVDTDTLEGVNLGLRDRLRGAGDRLTPGSQLSYLTLDGESQSGTLACFARDRATGDLGFLTNQHVGEFVGNGLFHPDLGQTWVGSVIRGELDQTITDLYGVAVPAGPPTPILKVDAGFCRLPPELDPALVDPLLPTVDGDRILPRKLGQPRPLDPTTMSPIGEEVLGIGRTRSYQKGKVVAAACDVLDRTNQERHFFELLIVSENDGEFSDPGDSGKLIVSAAGLEPLAIMWGGVWIRQRHGHDLENFTNATDIGRILRLLDVDIVR